MKYTKKLFGLLLSFVILISSVGCDLSLPQKNKSSRNDTFTTNYGETSIVSSIETNSAEEINSTVAQTPEDEMVWIPMTGTKFHKKENCGNMQYSTQKTKQEAERRGYEPCKNCYYK